MGAQHTYRYIQVPAKPSVPTTFTVTLSVRTTDSGGGSYNHSCTGKVTINYSNKTIALSNVTGHNDATGASGSGSGSAENIVWS